MTYSYINIVTLTQPYSVMNCTRTPQSPNLDLSVDIKSTNLAFSGFIKHCTWQFLVSFPGLIWRPFSTDISSRAFLSLVQTFDSLNQRLRYIHIYIFLWFTFTTSISLLWDMRLDVIRYTFYIYDMRWEICDIKVVRY